MTASRPPRGFGRLGALTGSRAPGASAGKPAPLRRDARPAQAKPGVPVSPGPGRPDARVIQRSPAQVAFDELSAALAGGHPTDPARLRSQLAAAVRAGGAAARPGRSGAAQATFDGPDPWELEDWDRALSSTSKRSLELVVPRKSERLIDDKLDKMRSLVVERPIMAAITQYLPKRYDVLKNPPKSYRGVLESMAELGKWSMYLGLTSKAQRQEDSHWVYQEFPLTEVGVEYAKRHLTWYNPLTWFKPVIATVKYGREIERDDIDKTFGISSEIYASQRMKLIASMVVGSIVSQSLRFVPRRVPAIATRPWLVKSFSGLAIFNMILTISVCVKQAEELHRKMKKLEDGHGKGGKELTRLMRERRDFRIDPFLTAFAIYLERYGEFEREYGYLFND